MRMSRLFSQTLREAPADAEVASHILLMRAGFIRQLASGIFSYLPLAQRALSKIEQVIREEMEAIGGQEIKMPVVHTADVWKASGRYEEYDESLTRFHDRHGRDMVLATTHEEIVADLATKEIRSYRQFPQMIFHFQTKWRDEARPTSGLLRVREFTMKDSYSLDATQEGLETQYRAHYQAYFNIFHRCGLAALAVRSDVGMMGGSAAHEFMYVNEVGENTLAICDNCNYSANTEVARFAKPPVDQEALEETERVATPDTSTIADLTASLGIPENRTAKAVFLMGRFKPEMPEEGTTERLVMAVIRGDLEVNEIKLANAAGALALRPAHDEEIAAVGAVAGYASPIGLKEGTLIVADDSIEASPNLVAGANETGFHIRNVNYGRDWQATVIDDIALAEEGHACADCGTALRTVRGVEVGNIFQLGTRYTDALGASYLDENGKAQSVIMGSYGIGIGRLLACVAQEYNDDAGLRLPVTVSPFEVHIVSLAKGESEAATMAQRLYDELSDQGVDVLLDDRKENPGVKFNDADLIGCPLRVTVGDRGLKKGIVEIKPRDAEAPEEVPVDQTIERIVQALRSLHEAIQATVVEVPYHDA